MSNDPAAQPNFFDAPPVETPPVETPPVEARPEEHEEPVEPYVLTREQLSYLLQRSLGEVDLYAEAYRAWFSRLHERGEAYVRAQLWQVRAEVEEILAKTASKRSRRVVFEDEPLLEATMAVARRIAARRDRERQRRGEEATG